MALLAHKKVPTGLHHLLGKRDGRIAALPMTPLRFVPFPFHATFVPRFWSGFPPLCGPRFPLSTDSHAAAGVGTIDDDAVTRGSEQARERQESNSQASSSHRYSSSASLPANLRGWPNGGGMVHTEAIVHSSAVVECGAVVHEGAIVEKDVRIGSCSVVGPNVRLGERTVLWNNVSLQHCTIGHDCTLHNGVSIGQDGFGFFVNKDGEMVKKPQELNVIVGNNVEIGANSCIDRGSWRDTEIGDNTKIDNLVQVGHNVKIGRCCLLCGQVGIGGSAELGDYIVLGGKAGVADHIKICSHVRLAAKTGVVAHIKEKGDYAGFPAVPAQEWRRSVIAVRKLGQHVKQILRPDNTAEDEDQNG